jgi:hypothetical protein
MLPRKTLRYGSRGADVVELQGRLNVSLPTIAPLLMTDGIFGPNTLARVKVYQQKNGLVVDGIVGPKTWAKLLGTVPATPPATTNLTRTKIVKEAKGQIGKIDYQKLVGPNHEPHGWEHLGTILENGAGLKFSDDELKKSYRPGNKDWCGIFCVYCYQLAGKQVTWDLSGTPDKGGPQGDVKKFYPWNFSLLKDFYAAIAPGDIVAVAAKSHHFIVVSTNPAAGSIESVDGNQLFGRITSRKDHVLVKAVAFYSPK